MDMRGFFVLTVWPEKKNVFRLTAIQTAFKTLLK